MFLNIHGRFAAASLYRQRLRKLEKVHRRDVALQSAQQKRGERVGRPVRLAAGVMLIAGLVFGAAMTGHLMGRVFDRQITALQVTQCAKADPWRR